MSFQTLVQNPVGFTCPSTPSSPRNVKRASLRLALLTASLSGFFPVSSHAQETNGLTAEYYKTHTINAPVTKRVDPNINFDWSFGAPAGTGITAADNFAVVWSGQILPQYSALYSFYVTANNGARLWIDDRLVAARDYTVTGSDIRGQIQLVAGQRVNIRLEYQEDAYEASAKLEWSCPSLARQVVPQNRLFPDPVEKAGGSLTLEHWYGIAKGSILALTPNQSKVPDSRDAITSFECLAPDWKPTAYGTRARGYIVPPVTGNYQFAISGDDAAKLRLSTDSNFGNSSVVADLASYTAFRDWTKAVSGTINLVQGKRYYIELLHEQNAGGDHWSVGWKKPGDTAFSVIPGSALVQTGLVTAQPAEANLLATLTARHPRLLASPERFTRLAGYWLSPTASKPKTWAQGVINNADDFLTKAPVTYQSLPNERIAAVTAENGVFACALAWQLTADDKYAERVWKEINAIINFSDWNTDEFLDTSALTSASAIAYDWLYDYWTEDRRNRIRTAIREKGLKPGLAHYNANTFWVSANSNNWNLVCNSAMILGALAIADPANDVNEKAFLSDVITKALNSNRDIWKRFTADNGVWFEGPTYMDFGLDSGTRMLAALEGALGSDFGLSKTRGVSEFGFGLLHYTGTSGVYFAPGDAHEYAPSRGFKNQWAARRFNQPVYDWWQEQDGGGPLEALWWNGRQVSPSSANLSPDRAFAGDAGTPFKPQEVVTLRGRWNDANATFVGVKGGETGATHGNLDAGTFALDMLGKRLFVDLKHDFYQLNGFFTYNSLSGPGNDRWDYYRSRTEGQNTLTINPNAGPSCTPGAVAPLIAYQSASHGTGAFSPTGDSFSIHDLSPVYANQGVSKVWRGVRLFAGRKQVLVQDQIVAKAGTTADVWWFAHYRRSFNDSNGKIITSFPSAVLLEGGKSAIVQQGNAQVWCKIVSGGGTFTIRSANPLDSSLNTGPQYPRTEFEKLSIRLPAVSNTTLAVWMVPLAPGESPPTGSPVITPLETWTIQK